MENLELLNGRNEREMRVKYKSMSAIDLLRVILWEEKMQVRWKVKEQREVWTISEEAFWCEEPS